MNVSFPGEGDNVMTWFLTNHMSYKSAVLTTSGDSNECCIFVIGCEKSSLNRDSNPGPLTYRASALVTELLRPDILTDSPVNPVT